jgi:hypothetical protein
MQPDANATDASILGHISCGSRANVHSALHAWRQGSGRPGVCSGLLLVGSDQLTEASGGVWTRFDCFGHEHLCSHF